MQRMTVVKGVNVELSSWSCMVAMSPGRRVTPSAWKREMEVDANGEGDAIVEGRRRTAILVDEGRDGCVDR